VSENKIFHFSFCYFKATKPTTNLKEDIGLSIHAIDEKWKMENGKSCSFTHDAPLMSHHSS